MTYIRNTGHVEKFRVVEKVFVMEFLFSIITGFLEKLGFEIQLKTDQKVTISCFGDGVDVLAVLPTGFSKCLILNSKQ